MHGKKSESCASHAHVHTQHTHTHTPTKKQIVLFQKLSKIKYAVTGAHLLQYPLLLHAQQAVSTDAGRYNINLIFFSVFLFSVVPLNKVSITDCYCSQFHKTELNILFLM